MRATMGCRWAAWLIGIVALSFAVGAFAQDEPPVAEPPPAVEEAPVDDAPAAEEAPVEADAPAPAEPSAIPEPPVADDTPAVEESPAAEEADHAPAASAAADDHAPGHEADHGADHASDHAAGHHDEHDLTHANLSEGATSPAEFKSDLALFTAVVFLLLMAILAKFAWGPISKALDERERIVAENIADAKRLHSEAEAKLRGYEQQIANTQEEVRQMLDRGKREAEAMGTKIVADAEASAARERQRSVAEIEAAKNQALSELAQKSVDTAVGLAGQIVRRSLTKDDHAKLIQEAIDQFPSQN